MSHKAFRKGNSKEIQTIVRDREAQLSALLAEIRTPYLMSDAADYKGPLPDIFSLESKLSSRLKHELLYRVSKLNPTIDHWTTQFVENIPDSELIFYRDLYLSMLTALATDVANVASYSDIRNLLCTYLKPAAASRLAEAEQCLFQRAGLLGETQPTSSAITFELLNPRYPTMKNHMRRRVGNTSNNKAKAHAEVIECAKTSALATKNKSRLLTLLNLLNKNKELKGYSAQLPQKSTDVALFIREKQEASYSFADRSLNGFFEGTYLIPSNIVHKLTGPAYLSIQDAEEIAHALTSQVISWRDTSTQKLNSYIAQVNDNLQRAIEDNTELNADALWTDCTIRLEKFLAGWGPEKLKAASADTVVKLIVAEHKEQLALKEAKAITQLHDYPAFFPKARAIKRHFVFLSGPTNSGKSWLGYEELAKAKSGVYLAPLRLLALEGQEQLTKRGVSCSLQTGEEQDFIAEAQHLSATVEMANFNQEVDVALIDEIQLLVSPDRGWAWTAACIGLPAHTIYVAGSPDALPFLERVIALTGDTLEVKHFNRLAPLGMTSSPVHLTEVKKGDAVIAFSRRDVLCLREDMQRMGYSVACIYGALGAEVRRAEAARFKDGSAEILISTDAIGLGLNLDIKRIIFSGITKFDGAEVRPLLDTEIRQIAGRAGRYGIHDKGEVAGTSSHDHQFIAEALDRPLEPADDTRLWVAPPWYAVARVSELTGLSKLGPILRFIRKNQLASGEHLRDVEASDNLQIADILDTTQLPLATRFAYLGTPLELRQDSAVLAFKAWVRLHSQGETVPAPFQDEIGKQVGPEDLQRLEQDAKLLTAYLWLSLRWPHVYDEEEAARWSLQVVNEGIALCLRTVKATKKRGTSNKNSGFQKQKNLRNS